jgi:hypothetical protein
MVEFSFRRGPLIAAILIMTLNCDSVLLSQTDGVRSSALEAFSVRGGVGTDLQLGLGFGAGAAYVWGSALGGTALEVGADIYYHHSTDSYADQRGNVTVKGEDKTTLTVFGVRVNALFHYNPSRKSVYFIAGFGFVVASRRWEENENAPNWIAPYHDEAEGTTAGNIINLGIGVPLGTNLDVRLETPMLYFYGATGKSVAFAPTATIGLTYRFN